MKKQKKNKDESLKWIIFLCVVIIILCILLFHTLTTCKNAESNITLEKSYSAMEGYKMGFENGNLNWNSIVMNSIQQNNVVPIFIDNQTTILNLTEYCENGKHN